MNRSFLIVLFFIVFDIRYCYSQQVTRDEAISVAQTYQKYSRINEAYITNVHKLDSNEYTLMYEIVFSNGTAVLISGNKQCIPIIGRYEKMSDSSIFESKDIPCGLRLFLMNYFNQLKYCLKKTTI